MTDKIDFAVVAKAGLTQKEFAELCGVSRITANLWVRGHNQPHAYIRDKVAEIIASLVDAVDRGSLPLSGRAPAPSRVDAITKALSSKQTAV